MEQDLLRVGVIANTHGVHGEVKVYPTTDDMNRFKKLKQVILDTGKEQRTLEISSVKFFKNLAILKFKGIDNINDIEKYKGKDLLITREQAVPLKKDEYFISLEPAMAERDFQDILKQRQFQKTYDSLNNDISGRFDYINKLEESLDGHFKES